MLLRFNRRELVLFILFSSIVGAAPASRLIRLRTVAEPREGAFTVLVPEGWQTEGGVYRVTPDQAGGAGNSVAAKLDFTIKRDPAGTVMVHNLPDNLYMDMRSSPAAAMFPIGSNYNGMVVLPPMSALAFLENVVLRQSRPNARNLRQLASVPLPAVAQSYDTVCRNMGLPPSFRNDTALLVVAYQEGGVEFKEVLYTDVQMMMSGLWSNKDTYMARAPVAEFDWMCRVFRAINDSMRIDRQWMAREITSQLIRAQIISETQQYTQRIDEEITRHRRETTSAINSQMQRLLIERAVETDPHTGKRFEVPGNRGQIFFGRHGEALLSEDPNWNPDSDPRYAGRGYLKPKTPGN